MSPRFFSPLLLLLLALITFGYAVSLPAHERHDHSHSVQQSLPAAWHHPPDHPAHALFRRDPPSDGTIYPPVGSPTWQAAYPSSSPNVSALPQLWVNALNSAVAAGKIPNIPQTTGPSAQNPIYPPGFDPTSQTVCSGTYGCRNSEDIWDAPPGHFGLGFDDGPLPPSTQLGQFLQQNNLTATHFVIGENILWYPNQFQFLFDNCSQDIAVHTWTHPYMTKLSNLEILGQLGWSMQILHDSTGGRLPRFWRPPYGDSDNRVRSIAAEVFGLRTIYWNHDTADWELPGGPGLGGIANSFQGWLTGPKTPGLIVLEHELTNDAVTAFMNAYPLMMSNGWILESVAQIAGNGSVYQNTQNDSSPVTAVSSVLAFTNSTSTTSSATPTPTALPASATPSISMLPSHSAALSQFGPASWSTHLLCVAIALAASVLLANPTRYVNDVFTLSNEVN